jgi:hypothetical protein
MVTFLTARDKQTRVQMADGLARIPSHDTAHSSQIDRSRRNRLSQSVTDDSNIRIGTDSRVESEQIDPIGGIVMSRQ